MNNEQNLIKSIQHLSDAVKSLLLAVNTGEVWSDYKKDAARHLEEFDKTIVEPRADSGNEQGVKLCPQCGGSKIYEFGVRWYMCLKCDTKWTQ